MAVGHYLFNDQTQHGRILRRVLNGAETYLEEGKELLLTGAQMIDGDGRRRTTVWNVQHEGLGLRLE